MVFATALARAQTPVTTFSVDHRSPAIAGGFTAGDILLRTPTTPIVLIPSAVPVVSGGLGLRSGCQSAPGDDTCDELDALSYGNDALIDDGGGPVPGTAVVQRRWWFSVDEFAKGIAGSQSFPNVASEGVQGAGEASADVFVDLTLPSGPWPPAVPGMQPDGCRGALDGDGRYSANLVTYPSMGLTERRDSGMACPGSSCAAPVFPCPAVGDDIDALDVDGPPGNVIYISLDSGLCDAQLQLPNTNSAAEQMPNAFRPGEVIKIDQALGTTTVFANTGDLGLDQAGIATDDLDALVLRDLDPTLPNPQAGPGDGHYQRAMRPYGWLAAPPNTKDMLLFSVRRGSQVIGKRDSIFGLPIEPGDVLVPPVTAAYVIPATVPVYGGMPAFGGQYPGIFMAAENFGLHTDRADGILFNEEGDDLDALDITGVVFDCDGDNIEDAINLVATPALDANVNGVLDACESVPLSYCTAGTSTNGCTPSIFASHQPSVTFANPCCIGVVGVEGQKNAIIFYGLMPTSAPWSPGSTSFVCAKAPTQRTLTQGSGGNVGACDGRLMLDWNAYQSTNPGALGQAWIAGSRAYAQAWYRDPPAVKTTNLSNGVELIYQP